MKMIHHMAYKKHILDLCLEDHMYKKKNITLELEE